MTSTPNTGYLIEDQWDDWFQYSTMYDLYIVDSLSHQCYMGKTKIGQKGMVEDQRRPALPESFSRLSEDFFSLGQDSYYYENIKNLGDVMRSEILAALNDIAYNTNPFANANDGISVLIHHSIGGKETSIFYPHFSVHGL